MRLTLFGTETDPALVEALSGQGFAVAERALASPTGPEATATLAAGLRDAEAALAGEAPAAVVVAGGGDAALAAALTAVKLEIPTAWLPPAAGDPADALPSLVADLTLDASRDASANAQAVRALAAPTLSSP